jgi:predicted enzyme related to lactoylglutathione lyase
MSEVTTPQPTGTPVWIDLGIPDLNRAMEFYGPVFGWEFQVGPPETGGYTMCLLDGKPVAALMGNQDTDSADYWWNVYFATDDCDGTAKRIADAGGSIVVEPMDVMDQGRMLIAKDPVGAQFGLWQAGSFVGAQLVNQPGTLLRNDLVTPDPERARPFYASVFDFTLDGNPALPDVDFTFLRRPDGHEIGGIVGEPAQAASSWGTLFLVEDVDATLERVLAAGGTSTTPKDMVYGRSAEVTDPFGAVFTIGSPPKG